jgi:hypothetical protein
VGGHGRVHRFAGEDRFKRAVFRVELVFEFLFALFLFVDLAVEIVSLVRSSESLLSDTIRTLLFAQESLGPVPKPW